MAIQKYEDMSSMELDIIKEIGSIGSGNAATALSSMLNTKVKMGIPEVSILEFNEAVLRIGEPEEVVAAVMVEMSNEISGIMLFVLKEDFAEELVKRMMGESIVKLAEISEMDSSALVEIGNIMVSSYINALSQLANVDIQLSVPQMAVNMLGGILSLPMAMFGIESDRIMMIEGKFTMDEKEVSGDILLLPDVTSLNVLMKKLGME